MPMTDGAVSPMQREATNSGCSRLRALTDAEPPLEKPTRNRNKLVIVESADPSVR